MVAWQELCTWLQYSNSENEPLAEAPIYNLIWSTIQGSLLAALMIFASDLLRRQRKPTHPGHWFLLINAMLIPVFLVFHTVLSFQIHYFNSSEPSPPLWFYTLNDLAYLQFYATSSIIWLVLCRFDKSSRHWKVTYVEHAVLFMSIALDYLRLLMGIGYTFSWFVAPFQFIILATIAVCLIIDVTQRQSRDWLHWFGIVVTFFAYTIYPVVYFWTK